MATSILKVPDIGDFHDVEIIEVLVKPGDTVAVEQSLITVESDKASMEIPATAAGTIVEMKVKLGDKVSQGSDIAVIEAAGEGAAAAPAAAGAADSELSAPIRASVCSDGNPSGEGAPSFPAAPAEAACPALGVAAASTAR